MSGDGTNTPIEVSESVSLEFDPKLYIETHKEDFEIKASTGTNSATLPGFSREKALVPTGLLLSKDKIAPFAGEIGIGVGTKGINRDSISLASNIETALKYAEEKSNMRGWNPTVGEQKIAKIHESMSKYPDHAKLLHGSLEVEQKRLGDWNKLTEEEQLLVSNPFPVVFGVVDLKHLGRPDTNYRVELGSSLREVTHLGSISINNNRPEEGRIVLYCPINQQPKVQQYLAKQNINIPIHPLEALKFLAQQRHQGSIQMIQKQPK